MARALVTGLTRVATLQAGSADDNVIVPVDRGYPHHNTSHGNQDIFSQVPELVLRQDGAAAAGAGRARSAGPAGKTVLAQHRDRGDRRVPAGLPRQQRRARRCCWASGRPDASRRHRQRRRQQQDRDGHRAAGLRRTDGAALRRPPSSRSCGHEAAWRWSAAGAVAGAGWAAPAASSTAPASGSPGPGNGPAHRAAATRARRQPGHRRPAAANPGGERPGGDPATAALGPGGLPGQRHRDRRASALLRRLTSPEFEATIRAAFGLDAAQWPGLDAAARSGLARRLHQQRRPPDRQRRTTRAARPRARRKVAALVVERRRC